MVDVQTIREEIHHVREDTDAARDVRLTLDSIEESLEAMESGENPPYPDRIKELRAEIDRLSDDADPAVADELDRLQEQVRAYERDHL
jgi:prefoldin subunit 5